jgi:hypothetical protein
MTRIFGIAVAFVVTLALAPISAEAQQISACVGKNGAIRIVAPNATCSSNETLLVWGGMLAGADFRCVGGQLIDIEAAFNFSSTDGVSFGSGISVSGPSFNSILLQQGIYQIHLSGARFKPAVANTFPSIVATLNAVSTTSWLTTVSVDLADVDIVGGDRLVSVTISNTSLQFINLAPAGVTSGICHVVITKLQ